MEASCWGLALGVCGGGAGADQALGGVMTGEWVGGAQGRGGGGRGRKDHAGGLLGLTAGNVSAVLYEL